MLYIVSTPIGNLKDITLRALEVLRSVEYVLCEDTRHSGNLLTHHEIRKPLVSFHQFNEAFREERVLQDLEEGKSIALISDAGTPLVCDPGERLVSHCHARGVAVSVIPGPCAPITALALSGFDAIRFQFVGFLPKKQKEALSLFQEILGYPGTTICFESPHRLLRTLGRLKDLAPLRKIAIARELTKRFEECLIGEAQLLWEKMKEARPRGEFVILIAQEEVV